MITMAPRTALGRFWNRGASSTAVARIRPDVISDASCDFAPADSAVAVWDRLASVEKPPNRPDVRLAAPSASISWSGSISSWWRAAYARPAPTDSPTARNTIPAPPRAR